MNVLLIMVDVARNVSMKLVPFIVNVQLVANCKQMVSIVQVSYIIRLVKSTLNISKCN